MPEAAIQHAPETSETTPDQPRKLRTAVSGVKRWLAERQGKTPVPSSFHGGYEKATQTTLAERHPDWPHIHVNFLFAPHANATDMAEAEHAMKQTDVFLHENASGNDYRHNASHQTRNLQKLTTPDFATVPIDEVLDKSSPNGSWRGSQYEPLFRGLHRSHSQSPLRVEEA